MALFDHNGRAVAVNSAMERAMGRPERDLLGLRMGESAPGHRIAGFEDIDETVERVLRKGETVPYEAYIRAPGETRERAWLISLSPVKDDAGQVRGMCLATFDSTEPFLARQRLAVLSEASLRIGATLDLTRTAEELAELGTEHFADFVTVDLLDSVLHGDEAEAALGPGLLLFRRTAQHSVLPGCPEAVVATGGLHSYHEDSPVGRALATGRAARYPVDEDSLRWWAVDSPERARSIRTHGIHSMMVVPLRARGTALGLAIFCRHRTADPFGEDDLWLAEELAARSAVCVDNARRYTRERATALALQRSLLPRHTPRQAAVEVASRYLPADSRAGIGGDWFDVIPLSGTRVALVVGDVVGHGVQASATMGRLRAAVRTLADVDMPPDELLTHLDDLVLRLDREDGQQTGEWLDSGDTGATCLYAVYDPVSRHCTLARAGHPAPAIVHPDHTVTFPELPAGPPLGLGGLPFESAELEMPDGSLIALFTDGLIESGGRDIDSALADLGRALTSTGSLDQICDDVLDTLLSGPSQDDIALLLARTRSLDASQVASWELPADPAIVAQARKTAVDQLTSWGLEEASFVTELVVSELVTNAIRYGLPPIRLRLIHGTDCLICEVSDASSTAPHLRRARVFDEGGRGLMLVAQLAQRWGTRHTPHGKTIWTEQTLGTGF
jgi:serine phosphatase RsbU (regulator of sigma subunit)/anti-sigma regulatory factor (Ser/Thr protein kinase)